MPVLHLYGSGHHHEKEHDVQTPHPPWVRFGNRDALRTTRFFDGMFSWCWILGFWGMTFFMHPDPALWANCSGFRWWRYWRLRQRGSGRRDRRGRYHGCGPGFAGAGGVAAGDLSDAGGVTGGVAGSVRSAGGGVAGGVRPAGGGVGVDAPGWLGGLGVYHGRPCS